MILFHYLKKAYFLGEDNMKYKNTSYFFTLFGILSALNMQPSLSAVATDTTPVFRGSYVANIGTAKAHPSTLPKKGVRGPMKIGTRGTVTTPTPKTEILDKKMEKQQHKSPVMFGQHRQEAPSPMLQSPPASPILESKPISQSQKEMNTAKELTQNPDWVDSKKTVKMKAQNAGNYVAGHIGRGFGTSLGAPKIGQDVTSALKVDLRKNPDLLDFNKKQAAEKEFRKKHQNLDLVDRNNIRTHAKNIGSEYGETIGGVTGSTVGRAAAVPVVAAIAGATSGIGAVAAPMVSTGMAVAGSTAGHIVGDVTGSVSGKVIANSAIKLHQKGFAHAQQGADTMEARVTGKPIYRDSNGDVIPYPDPEANKQREREAATLKVKAARAIGKRIGGATETIIKAPFNVQEQDALAMQKRKIQEQQDAWDKEVHGGLDLHTRAKIAKENRQRNQNSAQNSQQDPASDATTEQDTGELAAPY